ncbi:Putative germin-like protein 2-1 [Linum grandiflorum]
MSTTSMMLVATLTFCYFASASDPSPLQDFCVADLTNQVKMNGFACKNPTTVTASDFSVSGLHIPANTTNSSGLGTVLATVAQIPGLNTLGISMIRVDYAPWGFVSPHSHPRATEILTVIEGSLEVGFVTSDPDNRLISKILQKGLVHFQRNVGHENAVAIAALNSQNPGLVDIPISVFGSKPDIATDILAKAFQIDKSIVEKLQLKF